MATLQLAIIAIFAFGYVGIILERPLRLNKSATALLTGCVASRAFRDAGACGLFGSSGDFHWNAAGQALAARLAAESLRASGLGPPARESVLEPPAPK